MAATTIPAITPGVNELFPDESTKEKIKNTCKRIVTLNLKSFQR